MVSAITIYNQSIHSATGHSPFDLLYGPYERLIEPDLDLTIFQNYNEKRRAELLPFYDQVYERNKKRAEEALARKNSNRETTPNVEDTDVYVERNRPRKTDPPFERIRVTSQLDSKITGLTEKSRTTTANVRKIKRLRKVTSPLQETVPPPQPDEPQPSTSNHPAAE